MSVADFVEDLIAEEDWSSYQPHRNISGSRLSYRVSGRGPRRAGCAPDDDDRALYVAALTLPAFTEQEVPWLKDDYPQGGGHIRGADRQRPRDERRRPFADVIPAGVRRRTTYHGDPPARSQKFCRSGNPHRGIIG